jgi:hypothetical protein
VIEIMKRDVLIIYLVLLNLRIVTVVLIGLIDGMGKILFLVFIVNFLRRKNENLYDVG